MKGQRSEARSKFGLALAGHPLRMDEARRGAVLGVLPSVWLVSFHQAAFDLGRADLTDALHADRYRMVWVVGTYLFGGATGLAMTRFFSTRLGFRYLMVGALITFSAATGLCTLSPSAELMAPWRVLAGFSMGLVICSGMMILWDVFRQDQELAMTLYGIGIYLSTLAGIPIGGLLLDAFGSWRLLFWIQAPLGLGSAWLSARFLARDAPKSGTTPPKFDHWGLFFFAAFVVTMIASLYFGHYWGWFASPYFTPWGLSWVLATGAFIGWGLFAQQPLINLRPLRRRNFGLGLVVKALISINLFVLAGLIAHYLIELRGYQWWQGALVFLPALATATLTMLGGAHWGRDRSRKLRIFLGVLITALVTWKLAGSDLYTSKWVTAGWLAVWGAGFGLAIGPTMLTVFYGLPKDIQASSAGVFNIFRTLPVFMVHGLLVISLTSATDIEFHRLRKDITYERPIVTETMGRLQAQAHRESNGSPRVQKQPHAILGRWVHENAKTFALQRTLRLLALFTALNLLIIPWLRPPKGIALETPSVGAATNNPNTPE